MNLQKYKKEDFKRLDWGEYGQTLETLYKKLIKYLGENNLKVDVVIPILRGGGVAGTFLAYKLHLLKILPVQFKYLFVDGEFKLQNLTKIPDQAFKYSRSPTFLLVENNHCFGNTSKAAVVYLKKIVPSCRIIYTAAYMDYSYQEMTGSEVVLYGKLSNEARGLTKEQAYQKGISNNLSLFPWEDLEEEWAMVNEEGFDYNM